MVGNTIKSKKMPVYIEKFLDKAVRIQQFICDQVYESRKKDYDNPIRSATFRNNEEKLAVVGRIEDVSFVKQIQKETADFIASINKIRNN